MNREYRLFNLYGVAQHSSSGNDVPLLFFARDRALTPDDATSCHGQQWKDDVVLILLGYLVVLGTVFGGYLMTGGSLGALYQPAELVIIAGAGIGSFIVGNNGKAIKGTLKALPLLFRRSKYTKAMYMDLLALLYRLMAKSRQMGMFSLERDRENPRESEIFASYPRIPRG